MYTPPRFAISDDEVRATLSRAGLVHLVTFTGDDSFVTPLPMVFDAERHRLLGHVARLNPHWQAAESAVRSLAIIPGPQAYVTPSWYETKAETGTVVPTWNYDTVVVHGRMHVYDDPAWVRAQVDLLTAEHERHRPQPWQVADAPPRYVAGQLRAIVGVELEITRWEGKAKMSQNQPERNRRGVVAGLRESECPLDHAVADRVEQMVEADRVEQTAEADRVEQVADEETPRPAPR